MNRGRRYRLAIEEALGFPWNPEDLLAHTFDGDLLCRITDAVCSFYEGDDPTGVLPAERSQEIQEPELVPYLSLPYVVSHQFTERTGPLTQFPHDDFLTKVLLLSHKVLVDDPLYEHLKPLGPAGRRFFIRTGADSRRVRDYLVSMCDWLPLLEEEVILLKRRTLEDASLPALNREDLIHLCQQLVHDIYDPDEPMFDPDSTRFAGSDHRKLLCGQLVSLVDGLRMTEALGQDVVPFLDSPELIRRYRGLLNGVAARARQMTTRISRHAPSALDHALLASQLVLNGEAISARDLVSIRREEELFETWRQMVSEAIREFKTLPEAETGFRDFTSILRERAREWNSAVERKLRRSALEQARDYGRSAFVGFGTWSVTGSASDAIVPALLAALFDLRRSRSGGRLRTVARSHYLCIGDAR